MAAAETTTTAAMMTTAMAMVGKGLRARQEGEEGVAVMMTEGGGGDVVVHVCQSFYMHIWRCPSGRCTKLILYMSRRDICLCAYGKMVILFYLCV